MTASARSAARKANEDALETIVAAWTRGQDRWDVTEHLQARGIAAFPSLSARDVVEDRHLNARGFIERQSHPAVGRRPHTGIPWQFTQRANGVRFAAPCMGADTEAVMREVLGMSSDRISELERQKVLH